MHKSLDRIVINTNRDNLWIQRAAISLAETLRLAASQILDIEFTELITGCRIRENSAGLYVDIYLYDSLSSGAGYSVGVADEIEQLLDQMNKILSSCHCENACHDCLKHYRNRHLHGLLDRKLRVVSENTDTSGEWLEWAQVAYKNIYGYEWQGDNLLLAREALLWTFIENYKAKFNKSPILKSINYIAYIVSWNIWQMDGLKGVVPDSCKDGVAIKEMTLFGEMEKMVRCEGCQHDDMQSHNGKYCLIRDWGVKDLFTGKNNRKIRFIDLIKQ